MRCPFCGHEDSQVKDSRPTEDGAAIRRRRQCEGCAARFTTFERIQLRDLWVLKSNATGGVRREAFDREKLLRSVSIATRKRPIEPVRIETPDGRADYARAQAAFAARATPLRDRLIDVAATLLDADPPRRELGAGGILVGAGGTDELDIAQHRRDNALVSSE